MIFGMTYSLFWIIAALILVVIEAITLGIATIWFAIGALAAFLVAQMGFGFTTQFIVFLLVSSVFLYYTRPVFQKMLKVGSARTNVDLLVGQSGIVLERIDPLHGKGQVKVGGQIWSAKSFDGQPLEEKVEVEIVAVEGVKLVVTNKYIA